MLRTHSAKRYSDPRWFDDDLEITMVNASYGWSADCHTRSLRRSSVGNPAPRDSDAVTCATFLGVNLNLSVSFHPLKEHQ